MYPESRIHRIVPAVAAWRSFRGAFANVLVFGLAVLAGECLVHQLEYLLEYGRRFDTIMAATPHRFYMAQEGAVLAAAVALLLTLAILALRMLGARRQRHGWRAGSWRGGARLWRVRMGSFGRFCIFGLESG